VSAAAAHRTVSVATPEGVALDLRLADLGERAIAFVLDGVIVIASSIALGLTGSWLASALPGRGFLLALTVVAIFLLQSFYFVVFELRWQGVTPGKRWQHLRVVSRDGGPLTAGMVFARNVTRQVETTIPLVLLLSPRALTPDAPEWGALVAVIWAAVLLSFPLLNRHRARLGDLAAGTLVIAEPATELEPDLARFAGEQGEEERITFTRAQLGIYGNKELQVLEQVLRREPNPETERLVRTVALKVRRKIGWEPPEEMDRPPHPRRFLVAFYAAQRAHLEHAMLLGRAREEKTS
jgi:uncharacterized RDD family membrane protein YckC